MGAWAGFTPSRLKFGFQVTGPTSELLSTTLIHHGATHGFWVPELWKQTCFELFIGTQVNDRYVEWNLSPQLAWNVLCFSKERTNTTPSGLMEGPSNLQVTNEKNLLKVGGEINLRPLLEQLGIATTNELRGQLAAVLKTANSHEHWAQAHPKDVPDFHTPNARVTFLRD